MTNKTPAKTPIKPIAICTYLFPDDHRCGSPALRGEDFCYYHHPDRRSSSLSFGFS